MRKKLYLFPLLLLGFFIFATTSCLNSNNDNEEKIDEEWKSLNETRFAKVASDDSFNALSSQSGNGKVYWQESDVITKADADNILKITVEGKPEFTDTVIVRYEGWYFDKAGVKVIFESTENPSSRSRIDYTYGVMSSPDPNRTKATFAINPATSVATIKAITEGRSILLQDMKVNEERIVCMPQALGYANSGLIYTPTTTSPTFTLVPAYTTIWFRVKLYQIIPMKGLK